MPVKKAEFIINQDVTHIIMSTKRDKPDIQMYRIFKIKNPLKIEDLKNKEKE